MAIGTHRINSIVAALWLILLPLAGAARDVDDLFARLHSATPEQTATLEAQIITQWERSGSPAMDLLLRRGNDAMQAGDADLALGHFSALVDHAPDFAMGYFARASAYFLLDMTGPALADLAEVLTREPRQFEAMRGLAAIMEELDRPADALALHRMVQELIPQSGGTQADIARLTQQLAGMAL